MCMSALITYFSKAKQKLKHCKLHLFIKIRITFGVSYKSYTQKYCFYIYIYIYTYENKTIKL